MDPVGRLFSGLDPVLTAIVILATVPPPIGRCTGEPSHEPYLSAQQHPSKPSTWLSGTHALQEWTQGHRSSPSQGPTSIGGHASEEIAVRLSRDHRILKSSEFRQILRKSRRTRTTHLLVAVGAGEHFKLGMSVSKKVGNAVHRNRIRRRIREIVRLQMHPEIPTRVVITARPGCADLSFSQLKGEIVQGFSKLGIIPA